MLDIVAELAACRREVDALRTQGDLFPRCDLCGHRKGDHVGPSGACWLVDEGACASECRGYVAP